VHHVQAEVRAEQERAAADTENDGEQDFDDTAGTDEAEQRAPLTQSPTRSDVPSTMTATGFLMPVRKVDTAPRWCPSC